MSSRLARLALVRNYVGFRINRTFDATGRYIEIRFLAVSFEFGPFKK